MLENFHFIRPWWLLAVVPLALLSWQVLRSSGGDNPWRRIVDERLLPLLMVGRAPHANRAALWLVAAGWLVAVLALADPTWERRPQPVYQTTAARVVVLDLSRSMNTADLKPSRLVLARYKVEDVLSLSAEGQTGLVAYAGDAFTVSPLTRDGNTIRALLKVLDPEIMPARGSRADLGLLKAGELLRQAGASSGQVLLIADGVEPDKAAASEAAAARLRRDGYRVSVLGIGTEDGAPLTNAQGQLLRDSAGKIVISRLDRATLESVARAGGGEYRSISDTGEALSALLRDRLPARVDAATQTDVRTRGWKEQGPLLAVMLLPLAALAFRRNWLLSLVLLAGLASSPQPAMASTWDDLWHRPDQQSAKALEAGDYARAAELATDAYRHGSAEYKRGNYLQALEDFSRATGADADYNRGNALAELGRYQEALAAYDKALKEDPGSEDARANKTAVETLLKQRQQASNTQRDGVQKEQDRSNGGRSQGKGENPSRGSKSGQAGASSGQGQPSANAKKPEDGSQNGESSSQHGKDRLSQYAASGEASGPTRADSGTAQQNGRENQFADAARKLAEQGTAAKAKESSAANEASGGDRVDRTRAIANTEQRPEGTPNGAQPLASEERLAAEQWLRRIPDDPGGLLRRKFLYQYRQRAQHADADSQ